MSKSTRYAVIGAGNGGKAMAAHLALKGFQVNLYNRSSDHIAAIKARGGIELESNDGGPSGFGEMKRQKKLNLKIPSCHLIGCLWVVL